MRRKRDIEIEREQNERVIDVAHDDSFIGIAFSTTITRIIVFMTLIANRQIIIQQNGESGITVQNDELLPCN